MKIYVDDFKEKILVNSNSKICFSIKDEKGFVNEIRIRFNKDGTLNISSNDKMVIEPQASNSVFIKY